MPKIEWSSISTRIGVISGALGIVISSAAAYKIFFPKNKDKVEDKQALLQAGELAPRIEMSYVTMAEAIYYNEDSNKRDKKKLLFLDYPLLANEIASTDGAGTSEVFINTDYNEITYLGMQNQGKATPRDVKVILKRYTIKETVNIEESPGIPANYQSAITDKTIDSAVRTFSLPLSLETGNGVLIPLFVLSHNIDTEGKMKRSWSIISKIVYIPEEVLYTDPFDEKEKRVKVRSMKDPVRLATGIEGRG